MNDLEAEVPGVNDPQPEGEEKDMDDLFDWELPMSEPDVAYNFSDEDEGVVL